MTDLSAPVEPTGHEGKREKEEAGGKKCESPQACMSRKIAPRQLKVSSVLGRIEKTGSAGGDRGRPCVADQWRAVRTRSLAPG